jgi:dihydroflavonol-4-reductase
MNVITGAAGLIGANLMRALLAQGQPVRALVRQDKRALDGLKVEQAQGDLTNLDSLLRAFAGAEVVYHLAAAISLEMDSWEQVHAVNVVGTRNVVEACLRSGVRRLVHFSSIHALDCSPGPTPIDENRRLALDPHYPPYDRSKAAGELEVRAGITRGLDAVILNPTGVIGPHDHKPSHFGRAVQMLARGRVPAMVQGGFDWVDARDVSATAIRAAQAAQPGSSYLIGGHWHSVRELAELVAKHTGRTPPRLTVPMWLAYAAAPLMRVPARLAKQDPVYTRVSLLALEMGDTVSWARAARDLDHCPRPFTETIADTVQWQRVHGTL